MVIDRYVVINSLRLVRRPKWAELRDSLVPTRKGGEVEGGGNKREFRGQDWKIELTIHRWT
jgi:hypothetical protein